MKKIIGHVGVDSVYPVEAEFTSEGRVKSLTITFIGEEDENDEF